MFHNWLFLMETIEWQHHAYHHNRVIKNLLNYFITYKKLLKMKPTLKTLILVLIVGGLTTLFSCGGDDPTEANDFCDFEICASSDAAKAVCEDEYDSCLSGGGDPEECAAFANETCTL